VPGCRRTCLERAWGRKGRTGSACCPSTLLGALWSPGGLILHLCGFTQDTAGDPGRRIPSSGSVRACGATIWASPAPPFTPRSAHTVPVPLLHRLPRPGLVLAGERTPRESSPLPVTQTLLLHSPRCLSPRGDGAGSTAPGLALEQRWPSTPVCGCTLGTRSSCLALPGASRGCR